jgi:NAD+ synthase
MATTLTLAMAQLDPTVGDVAGNGRRLLEAREAAAAQGADLIIASELFMAGYPPEDLVMRPAFQAEIRDQVLALAAATNDGGPWILVGAPWVEDGKLHNSAVLLGDGKVAQSVHKQDLPNHTVFDEKRVFTPGPPPPPIDINGALLGILVCEDMWSPKPATQLADAGAQILVVLNGSPFDVRKPQERRDIAGERVTETSLPLIYVNQVGGQDELVFDGASFVLDADGATAAQAKSWQSDLMHTQWELADGRLTPKPSEIHEAPTGTEAIYLALMTGLQSYVGKNGFQGVVLGLSGGIDSALSAAVAVDALGAEAVHCVMLPSKFTPQASIDDAEACAAALGAKMDTIPIHSAVDSFTEMLAPLFAGTDPGVAEENLQARARAATLMALSNKFGSMLLTTGNKSEMSVGYATLYGDMSGGFSVLKDVYKTTVYDLARWRNGAVPSQNSSGPHGQVIPDRILTKPPSAELRPGQTDQDTLPPYDDLDGILKGLIENELGVDEIAAKGFDPDMIASIEAMVYGAEYKRRQAPPGVRITRKAFGRDRRYPITNRFRDRPGRS